MMRRQLGIRLALHPASPYPFARTAVDLSALPLPSMGKKRRKPPAERRDTRIIIRVTDDEEREIREAAAADRTTLSEWIRRALRTAVIVTRRPPSAR